MSNQAWDNIALFCLFASVTTPFYIIPIFWKKVSGTKTRKFLIGMLIALGFTAVLSITGFFNYAKKWDWLEIDERILIAEIH